MSSNSVFQYVFNLLLHCCNISDFLAKPLQRLWFLLRRRIIYVASILLSCTGSDAMIWKITVWVKWASVQMQSHMSSPPLHQQDSTKRKLAECHNFCRCCLLSYEPTNVLGFLFDKQFIKNLKVYDTSGSGKKTKHQFQDLWGNNHQWELTKWLLNNVQCSISAFYGCILRGWILSTTFGIFFF